MSDTWWPDLEHSLLYDLKARMMRVVADRYGEAWSDTEYWGTISFEREGKIYELKVSVLVVKDEPTPRYNLRPRHSS